MNRKEFMQTSALAAASLVFPSATSKSKRKIGLQLYTVRDVIVKDPKVVTKQLADLGYQELETFAYNEGTIFGMKFKEYGDYVKDLGMKITSGHYPLGSTDPAKAKKGTILTDWESAVADAKTIGQDYMVVPFLQESDRKTIDQYKSVCEKLNKAGEVCNKYGIRLNYHNHAFEYETLEGQKPFDVMLASLDPKLVGIELDLFWAIFANEQPLEYFKKHPGRFEQWHVKDMSKDDRKKNAFVGTGSIDFQSIFAQAKQAGMKHFYIEHDNWPTTSIDSVGQDIKNVKGWTWI